MINPISNKIINYHLKLLIIILIILLVFFSFCKRPHIYYDISVGSLIGNGDIISQPSVTPNSVEENESATFTIEVNPTTSTFLGWFNNPEGTGTPESIEQTYTKTNITANVILYPKALKNAYSVSIGELIGNGDIISQPSVTPNSVEENESATFTIEVNPTTSTFLGWFNNPEGTGTPESIEQTYTKTNITTNVILYPKALKNAYSVSIGELIGNGDVMTNAEASPTIVYYDESATFTIEVNPTTSNFIGWFDNPEGTGTPESIEQTYTKTNITTNVILYPKVLKYYIASVGDMIGIGEISTSPYVTPTIVNHGYSATFIIGVDSTSTFLGWFDNSEGTGTPESIEQTYTKTNITTNITLYPMVEQKLYLFVTKWGSYGTEDGQFKSTNGICVDSLGNVYVVDTGNARIQKFDSNGNFITKWGSLGTGDGQFNQPYDIEVDSLDNIFVSDMNNHRIQKFDNNGNFITKFGTNGTGNGQFKNPNGLFKDSDDNLYVADTINHRIQKFDSNNNFVTKWGSMGDADGQLKSPFDVCVDSLGNVYVAELSNNRISKFTSTGTFIMKWGSMGNDDGQFFGIRCVNLDNDGNLYVADTQNYRVQVLDNNGNFLYKWGSNGTGDYQFNQLFRVYIDRFDNIYIADTGNHRIMKFRKRE